MSKLDVRRVWIYLAFAFGIAWTTAVVVYLTGGLVNSPVILPGAGVTLAFLLIAVVVMWAPAFANILTRLVTREGRQNLCLRPRLRQGWPYWLLAWVGPGLLIVAGAALYFALFPQHYDPELGVLRSMLDASGASGVEGAALWTVVAAQVLQGVLISPFVNGWATFGEEFGWRGYLQPKLMPLGGRKTMLLMGLIWGVWHWPIILMGHNFGLQYPGAPFLGPLVMVWFTFVVGTVLGWLTLKGRSVWPAVIGHAAVNGMAAIGAIFVQGQPNPLLGPTGVGLISSAGFAIVTLLLYLTPNALEAPPVEAAEQDLPAPQVAGAV